MTAAEELKVAGNEAFQGGRFEDAEGLYTKAIAAAGSSVPAVLYGNRSATRLALERPEAALEDADAALAVDPTWLKGWHRKACAHKAMAQPAPAFLAYRQAAALEPQNRWVLEQLRAARKELQRQAREMPIPSQEYLMTVFSSLTDPRERLSTLAYFWNDCHQSERYAVFRRFLEIVAGAGSAHTGISGADFTEENMAALPLDNYVDLPPVATWLAFMRGLEHAEKVALFEEFWSRTTAQEKDVIANDMKTFFLAPMLEERFGKGGSSGDGEKDGEDGGDDDVPRGNGAAAAAAAVTADAVTAAPAASDGAAIEELEADQA